MIVLSLQRIQEIFLQLDIDISNSNSVYIVVVAGERRNGERGGRLFFSQHVSPSFLIIILPLSSSCMYVN
jgi:hypothetical protein